MAQASWGEDMGQVQIGAALGASFRFISEAWNRAWGIMLVLVWFNAALQIVELLRPRWGAVAFLGLIVSIFVTTAATGALYRLRLAGDHPGDDQFAAHPAGLQWGGLEWRVLGANLLVGVIIAVLVFVAIIVWAIIFGVTVGSSPDDMQALQGGSQSEKLEALRHVMLGPAGVLTVILIGPMIVALIYVIIRLSMFALLAADARSFDLVKAWTLARGVMLPLFLGSLVIFLIELAIGVVSGGLAGFAAGIIGQQGRVWGSVAGQVVGAAINAPLFAGLVLYVYRIQRGDRSVAATFS
ncbi:MAG: hypothetical protein WDM85_08880 [Caulobacteraceae bacterium]